MSEQTPKPESKPENKTENKPEEKPESKSFKDKFSRRPNMPKNPFNFYWVYGIIAVALIAMQMLNFSGGLKEVKSS